MANETTRRGRAEKDASALEETNVEETSQVEETTEAPVKSGPKSAVAYTGKNVPIRPLEDHTCTIAGIKYTLFKGVQTEVPTDVCAILQNSGVAIKL